MGMDETRKDKRESGRLKRLLWAAAGILVFLAGGCGREAEESVVSGNNVPVVNLRAIILGGPPETGMDELYRQLDALTIPELNCTLRFEFIPWGDERKQLNIATASGEYDFIPGGVFSDYRTLIYKNAFLDLNEYLHLVPELQEHYSDYRQDALQSCEINGGLYGIPQFSVGVRYSDEGFFFREDLRKEWGLEPVTDLDTMEAYLYRAKEDDAYRNRPLITDNRIWMSLWLIFSEGRYLEINSMQETPFVVARADEPGVLLNRMETPEFREVVRYIRKWREDGILESNMLTLSDNEGERGKKLMVADRKPCETNAPIWSISSNFIVELWEAHPEWEYGFFPYVFNNQHWYKESIAGASVISVSSKTQYPETAVRLLEKIHTDQRYYDLLRYGVEGIHYQLVDGKLDFSNIANNNRFGWTPVTDDLLSYDAIQVNEKWYEETARPHDDWQLKISEQAESDLLEEFTGEICDQKQIMEEIEDVKLKYFDPILCGYQEDYEQALDEANEALYRAGFREYLDRLQSQLEDYIAKAVSSDIVFF